MVPDRRIETPISVFLTLLAVLGLTPAARATVIYSSPISFFSGGEALGCSLLNAGAKPLTALSPAPTIEIELLDQNGMTISGITSTTCTASLAHGQVCDTSVTPPLSTGFTFVYCKITFSGAAGAVRASLRSEQVDGNTLVAVPFR